MKWDSFMGNNRHDIHEFVVQQCKDVKLNETILLKYCVNKPYPKINNDRVLIQDACYRCVGNEAL